MYVVTAVVVIISLLLHELAHIGLVKAFGGQVRAVRVRVAGLGAWVRGVERFALWKRYGVYLAGPLVNGFIAFFAVWLMGSHTAVIELGATLEAGGRGLIYIEVLQNIFLYNMVLCVFNLLPVLPLDGGRLMQLFLGNRMGVIRANRVLLKIGPFFGGLLMCLGLVQAVLYPGNISLLCAGKYIRDKNKELPAMLYWEFVQGLKAKEGRVLRVKKITLPKDMPAKQALEYLGLDYWGEIDIGGGVCISEKELVRRLLT